MKELNPLLGAFTVSCLRWIGVAVALLAVPLLLAGCRSDELTIVPVEGTVTLNGRPLQNARVLFQGEGGRPAGGITDFAGRYELIFTDSQNGARVGDYVVTISTFRAGDPDLMLAEVPERVPVVYNTRTTLTATIEPGRTNVIDFALVDEREEEGQSAMQVPVDRVEYTRQVFRD